VPYLSEYQAQLIETGDSLALDAAAQEIMAAGIYMDQASAEEEARRKSRAVFAEAVYNSRLTLEALESLIRGLAGLSGRKALFLVSDGFLTGYTAGSGTSFDLRRIADAGTRAGVVIYALDTRGLPATPPIASASSQTRAQPATAVLIESMRRRSEEAMRDAMHALAADTGGSLVESTNDLRAGLRRLLKDTDTYYVLAYEPTNPKRDGAFRRIEVRLPGVRDGKVRTRSGYFAPDDRHASSTPESEEALARRAEQRQSEMRTALRSLAPLTAIPVQLSADFVSLDQGVTEVVISGHIDLATLPFVQLRDRHQAIVESVAVVYDENGAAVATLETERTAIDAAGEDYQQVLKRGLAYQKAVALKTGRYQVRLAAREDTTGRLGSASQWVEVPDLGPARLTLSSVFLLKESETSAAPSNPEAGLVLQNAQAVRRYRRSESLYAQLYAYNPKRDATGATDLVSQAEILRAGVSMGTAAPEPMAPAEPDRPPVPHTTRIKLQRFEPGNYELRVTVTDRKAVAMVSRRVGFTVY
jgi:VWFA-related protein